jgi:HD-GYP domain-containing protein (c-di-GMP phosphodiesterase class II)
VATDGPTAARQLAKDCYDLAFLDVVMPGRSGRTVAQRAMRENPELVVVMMTGFPAINDAVELMKGGSWDFLFKPVSMKQVLMTLDAAVHRRVELFVPPTSRQIVNGLVRILEGKDKFQAGHGERVSVLCQRMARRVPMSTRDRELLAYAALAHDVGKVRVPQHVLNKTGKLTEEEWAIIRGHPASSAEILESVRALTGALSWVRAHHERPDGSGYPDGLTADAIPFPGQLIAVADTYDAMRCERGYRPALSAEEAAAELRRVRGTQLTARAVDLFFTCLEKEDPKLWETPCLF